MVIAVWRQIRGGSAGGWSALARPSRGDSEPGAEGAHERRVAAEGGAGQPLVSVSVGAVFALELVGAAGGDLLVVELAGDGVVAQPGGGGDQRPGQGRAVPGSLDQDGSAGVCLDAELVGAVVHDRGVAQRPGGQVEPLGQGLGVGAVVAEPPGLVAAGGHGGQHAGAGAAGVFAGPGQGQADGEVRQRGRRAGRPGRGGDGGLQRPGRSCAAAFPCRPRGRGGRLRGRTSRRRGRWRTVRRAWTGRGRTAGPGWRPARCSRRTPRVLRRSGR